MYGIETDPPNTDQVKHEEGVQTAALGNRLRLCKSQQECNCQKRMTTNECSLAD